MIIKTNSKGYNYKYTDLAGVNQTLDELKMSYQQETRTDSANGEDYIWTRVFDKDGKVVIDWTRGAKIVNATLSGKVNPAQEYGSALTYARRYSLYMCLGIATEDDDGEKLTGTKKVQPSKAMEVLQPTKSISKEQDEILTQIIKDKKISPDKVLEVIKRNCNKDKISDLTDIEARKLIEYFSKYEEKNLQ